MEEGRYEELAEEEQQDEPEENADINIPSPGKNIGTKIIHLCFHLHGLQSKNF